MQSTYSAIKLMFITLFFTLIGFLIPPQRKRFLVIASLHTELIKNGVFHDESLSKLNSLLHLADDETTLVLPEAIYETVWDKDELSKILHHIPSTYSGDTCMLYDDARRTSEEILQLTPKWLRYDTLETMTKDLINLFYCQPVKTA